jgi:hypothetical protein
LSKKVPSSCIEHPLMAAIKTLPLSRPFHHISQSWRSDISC